MKNAETATNIELEHGDPLCKNEVATKHEISDGGEYTSHRNISAKEGMVLELSEVVGLTSGAIGRILHMTTSEVAYILEKSRKTGIRITQGESVFKVRSRRRKNNG